MNDKEFKYFIIATLRRASYRWRPRTLAMNKNKIRRGIYLCNICKKETKRKDIRIDHISPVVDPQKGFTTWDEYITRMFCNELGFQGICLECHEQKSSVEREIRKKYRQLKNK